NIEYRHHSPNGTIPYIPTTNKRRKVASVIRPEIPTNLCILAKLGGIWVYLIKKLNLKIRIFRSNIGLGYIIVFYFFCGSIQHRGMKKNSTILHFIETWLFYI